MGDTAVGPGVRLAAASAMLLLAACGASSPPPLRLPQAPPGTAARDAPLPPAASSAPAADEAVLEGTVSAFVRASPPACLPRSPLAGAEVTLQCPGRPDVTVRSGADGRIALRSAGAFAMNCTLTATHPDSTQARPLRFFLFALCKEPSPSGAGCMRADVSQNVWFGQESVGEVESSHQECTTACPLDPPANGAACPVASLRCTYFMQTSCPAVVRCQAGVWNVKRQSQSGNYACPNEPACPPSTPEEAARAPGASRYCHYEDSPAPGCVAHAAASGGRWYVSATGCPVPAAASCPAATPTAGARCAGAGLVCEYGNGASWLDDRIAVCEAAGAWSVAREPDVDLAYERAEWLSLSENLGVPVKPAAGCPRTRPRVGTKCSGAPECGYFKYWSERCEAGRWTSRAAPPPGPPPGR